MNDFFENIISDIQRSVTKSTRRKVKTIFSELGAKTTSSQKVIDFFKHGLSQKNLEVSNDLKYGMSNREYINFWVKGTQVSIDLPLSDNSTNTNGKFELPDDFFRNLFEFESEQEYERFQACLDSSYPMAIFLVPENVDFYSNVVERILSYEIVRKRQQKGDGAIIGNYRNTNFSEISHSGEADISKAINQWQASDIHCFDESTLESVILGESGKELIESEKFERQFNQLSFYSNKYYSESDFGNQFFLVFKCPSNTKLKQQNKFGNLDKLINRISAKLPYTFKLKSKFSDDEQLNINQSVKLEVVNHFKLLFEVPYYNLIDINEPLLEIYVELQKTQVQAESQLFSKVSKEKFKFLEFSTNESNEHIYLKQMAVNTFFEYPEIYSQNEIICEQRVASQDEILEIDFTSIPDVKVVTRDRRTIVVEAETLRGKDYLRMTTEIIGKGNGWKGLENFSELWLLLPGFEVARNYYLIKKSIELIKNELTLTYNKEILVKVFCPNLINQQVVEVSLEKLYNFSFQIVPRLKIRVAEIVIKNLGFENVKGLHEEKATLLQLKAISETDTNLGIGGILFYGLPGCGKTYLAKGFAEELGWNFFTFSPADLISQWIGQSQQNIRDIFKQAKEKGPSILFIDELDAIAFNRDVDTGAGAHSDQKATINQLLVELNNVGDSQVLVIGATNFIKSLDPAIKRSGRFDLKIAIYPPSMEERKEIIAFYLNKLNSEILSKGKNEIILSGFELETLAIESKQFTSSDLKAIFNQPRIEILLNKLNSNYFERILEEIKNMRDFGNISLTEEQVGKFILECEGNKIKSKKLEVLKAEWNLNQP